MNIWNDCEQKELTSLLSFIVDNRGKTVPVIDDSNGIKLIATNCIKNESLYPIYEKVRYLSEDTYKNWFRAHPVPGDIIFVNKGTPGKVAFVPNPVDFCIAQDMMAFRCKSEIIYNKYLFAVLRNPKIQEQIRITSVGDVIPHFKKEFLSEIKIPVPDMKIQKYLGDMYFMYSDKIELNNKINVNLGQQAQTIFKSWFVDFEPFGGEMPAEWKVGKLSEIANYSSDKISISELNNDTYYSTENMLPDKAGVEAASTIPNIIQTTRCFPGETIISNIRPYFKKIYYCTEKKAGCSTDVLCFKPITEKYSEYLYQILYSDKFFDYMVLGSKGTKMPRGDKQQIMNYGIVIPDNEYLLKFKNFAKPILEQTDYNRKENKRLANLRDTLLPKLMNGEIEM